MRITQGKVVDGQVVVEGEPMEEGASVTILVCDESSFTLTEAEAAQLRESIAEADAGELIDASDLLRRLP